MKRYLLIACAGIFGLAAVVLAADEKINLNGTWALDKEKSDPIRMPGRGGQSPDPVNVEMTLVISHTENELQITRKMSREGQERTSEQKFTLDGQENTNQGFMGRGEFKSKTKVKDDKVIIEGVQLISTPDRDLEVGVVEEYSTSEDGKVLTLKTTRDTPRGTNTSKMVFNKQ